MTEYQIEVEGHFDANDLSRQRLIARLTSIFGLLALGLACLGSSFAAGLFPAWRTASVDPMQALRTE
jgi:ABC-type lipoprotein release transport system permease subunit